MLAVDADGLFAGDPKRADRNLQLLPPPRLEALEKLAANETGESRVRAVAYHRLRAVKAKVPKGQLLGVIVEVPLEGGLDVLAVFADGRMRYLNHSGKIAVFESTPAAMTATQERLLKAAAAAIERIGPWDKPRLPPPKPGNARLSFLVSDGLVFRGGTARGDQQGSDRRARLEYGDRASARHRQREHKDALTPSRGGQLGRLRFSGRPPPRRAAGRRSDASRRTTRTAAAAGT